MRLRTADRGYAQALNPAVLAALVCLACILPISRVNGHQPPGVEYKIYCFPDDALPVIDGDGGDWARVPAEYSVDGSHLRDTVMGKDDRMSPDDLRVEVTVAWSPTTNRLYFLYRVWDDLHNFREDWGDIFEVVLDADHSGGQYHSYSDVTPEVEEKLKSTHCQNYHIFTPPGPGRPWAWVWGSQQWLVEKPWSEHAYSYAFGPGEPGPLCLEFSISPFNYASYLGPEFSAIHKLTAGEIVGLSWSVLDYDEDNERYEGFWNLSHNTRMDRTADLLPNFRLMPLEPHEGIE